MKKKNKYKRCIMILVMVLFTLLNSFGIERKISINKTYLNFPIQYNADRSIVYFIVEGDTVRHANFNLSLGDTIDSWTSIDFSIYYGKKLIISSTNRKGVGLIYQSDDLSALGDSLYNEKFRPQLSYSPRRSWAGDPNGLIYYKGEYHLFYQHPPFDIYSWYPAWGHAVSKDLIHWEELAPAIYPDKHGVIFSGSAVNDINNTAGFGDSTLVAIYTNTNASITGHQTPFNLATPFNSGRGQVQCIAYSRDKGRTFTKYEGNPVLIGDEIWGDETRDPKVFWYAPNKEWVMVLFQGNGQSFFTSNNLKEWKYESHTRGLRECPELFELPVDGDSNNKKWVALGAASAYMIGDFDGKKFIPTGGPYLNSVGSRYASQTFNDAPVGRKIELAFTLNHWWPEGLPYGNHVMNFPVEFSLRTTRDGIRLFREPVKEIESLYKKFFKWEGLTGVEANEKMKKINENNELLHVKARVEMTMGLYFNIYCHDIIILAYDGNSASVNYPYPGIYTGRIQYSCDPPGSRIFNLEIIIDRTTAEVYMDHGKLQVVTGLTRATNKDGLTFPNQKHFKVHSLEVHTLESIWKNKIEANK